MVGAVIRTAVEWVYKGLVWALDIVLPKDTAEKVAGVLTTVAVAVGAAYFFYWGYKFLYAGPKAASLFKFSVAAAVSTPLALLYGAGRVGPFTKWMKVAYGYWAFSMTAGLIELVP
ncbi:unnamed protein product [marine sediment metagenome]|uniref:Uncharacterized protein n=1 Tax=marine sediment metagenome TaxID=412755 RepID=X1ERE5_9ZZZZ